MENRGSGEVSTGVVPASDNSLMSEFERGIDLLDLFHVTKEIHAILGSD
jgi:hypothetical protein